jgi:uncharacterized protein (DUF1919 family)
LNGHKRITLKNDSSVKVSSLAPSLADMMSKFKNLPSFKAFINWRLVDPCFSWFARRQLLSKDFSIISNNCVAGGIYHKFGLKYNSPTVGTFFFADDYIKFLENLKYYVKLPLKFTDVSKHPENKTRRMWYPIGVLGDVEVHFRHYQTEREALEKWNRRVKRVNFNNLFVILVDRGYNTEFTAECFERFDALRFEHKVLFSFRQLASKFAVLVDDFVGTGNMGESSQSRNYEKNIDLIKWLNGVSNFLKPTKKGVCE